MIAAAAELCGFDHYSGIPDSHPDKGLRGKSTVNFAVDRAIDGNGPAWTIGAPFVVVPVPQGWTADRFLAEIDERVERVYAGIGDVVSPLDVVDEVARAYKVEPDDILGDIRTQRIIKARKMAMYIIREMTTLSYPEIGCVFGRDHTTVMHHVASVKDDPERRAAADLIIAHLTARVTGSVVEEAS